MTLIRWSQMNLVVIPMLISYWSILLKQGLHFSLFPLSRRLISSLSFLSHDKDWIWSEIDWSLIPRVERRRIMERTTKSLKLASVHLISTRCHHHHCWGWTYILPQELLRQRIRPTLLGNPIYFYSINKELPPYLKGSSLLPFYT